ncbi:hypothetical protein [Saccharothrix obliqua]|uniref:hypothetical protein n=1 Tax=Saccharothrix obliqua TaxID=2861747 RepID=UPI001C5FD0FD|nr:hypothetical protein [Saccharothrix obliqua]MBW4716822.1 hypothetical protein [Saccharothrix obliqua]
MNTAAKLSAYGAVLVLVAGAAWAAGSAVGPLTAESAPRGHGGTHGGEEAGHGDAHGATVAGAERDQPAGLASSRGGYTLTPTDSTQTPGTPFTFRVLDHAGNAVTAFDVEHEKRLHLIVVRRDTAHFRHVHPEMAPDGTWSTALDFPEGGVYRVFADFKPTGGEAVTLGADVSVAGGYEPRAHAPSRVAEVDGYRVRLAGDLVAGEASPIRLTVTRDGRPVTDLQPYLGAYGHLVALRQGDLAYLHVHPEGGDGRTAPGPEVSFTAETPTAGTYRLFLDFQHDGVVRTAEFTVEAGRGH